MDRQARKPRAPVAGPQRAVKWDSSLHPQPALVLLGGARGSLLPDKQGPSQPRMVAADGALLLQLTHQRQSQEAAPSLVPLRPMGRWSLLWATVPPTGPRAVTGMLCAETSKWWPRKMWKDAKTLASWKWSHLSAQLAFPQRLPGPRNAGDTGS